MKFLLSHATGNQNVRHALAALLRDDALIRYDTTLGWSSTGLFRHLGSKLRHKLSRRSYDVPPALLHISPWREISRLSKLFGANASTIDDVLFALDREVAADIPGLKVRHPGLTGVYAYEDSALLTLQAARKCGLDAVYELPIGYWRAGHRIFNEERDLKPDWAATLTGLQDPPEKLQRKDDELRNADVVLCASSFTRTTLKAFSGPLPELPVIPYGAPTPIGPDELYEKKNPRLRLLFVGGLSQRKGLSYLFDAVAALGDAVELTVVGRFASDPPPPVLQEHLRHCRYIPSLPHGEILQLMRQHDLFLFPSLFEGFGLVLLEAMSQGLPCVTTTHTAGPDIIEHRRDGFIVPVRSTEGIIEAVRTVLDDPPRLVKMKRAALAKAGEMTWKKYEDKLLEVLRAPKRSGAVAGKS